VKVASSGEHYLSAVAVDGAGRKGVTASPMLIEIGTAAEIVARMPTLSKDPGVGTIVLTDTQTLTLASKVQLSEFLSYASTLKKIEGDIKFQISTAVSGQSYNKQTEVFSESGALLERLRYSGTKLTYDEMLSPDGRSVTRVFNADNSSTISETLAGKTLSSAQVNAKGIMTLKTIFNADGTREIDYFDGDTGARTKASLYKAEGVRVDVYYGLKGGDYTSQAYTFDKAGKNILLERFNDAGTKVYARSWPSDGSMETHYYNASGKETNFAINFADGSRAEGNMMVAGQSYAAQVVYYSKANAMTMRERFDADGHIKTQETFGAGASVKTYAYDAKTGAMTGWTAVAADKTSVVVTVHAGSETKIAKSVSYDAAGKVVKTEYFDTNGNKISAPDADGATHTYSYDPATGLKVALTVKAADGSTSVTKFAPGNEKLLTSVEKFGADGSLKASDLYGDKGLLVSRMSIADNGDIRVDRFDANGKTIAKTFIHDGVREEQSLVVSGKYYASQEATYDAANKLLHMTRYYADGKPAFEQTVVGDGTQIVKEWSAAGVLTMKTLGTSGTLASLTSFDANGVKVQMQVTGADGSRSTHYYDKATGAETTSLTVNADKSRTEANYAVKDKPYSQQIATYDKAGKLVEMIRKHGDAGNTLAFQQKVNGDGSAEVHQYDDGGRATSKLFTAADGSRDAFSFSYGDGAPMMRMMAATATTDATPSTVQQDHFSAKNVREWSDVTNADGSHVKTAYVAGVTLASSTADDTLVGFRAGGDTFKFAGAIGHDTVQNFGAGQDRIVVDDGLAKDFAALSGMLSKLGADTLISFDAGNSILVKNVAPHTLTADDFKFVHADVLSA
jgi:antitoxin component YwqK of YwqJK toxin-antitoxin module